jgi:alpha-methylacyl-CoA racemase
MPGPLEGVRLVEFVGKGPGPFAAMVLAGLGADVLRLDRPEVPEVVVDEAFDLVARGRDTVKVDLKDPGDVQLALDVVGAADAVIEGFRPGVMERLGLGPGPCLERNPRLVYGRMTGWGQVGPRAATAGHDINYIAIAGALGAIGRQGQPPTPPLNLVGDYGGGGMFLALGIVAGLFEASRSGVGQVVDAAMVDGASVLLTQLFGDVARGAYRDERGTNMLDSGAPYFDVYRTLDGRYVAVGSLERKFFETLMRQLGLDPASTPDHRDRSCWPGLRADFERIFATRTRQDWVEHFRDVDCCFSPVLSPFEALADEGNVVRGVHVDRGDGVLQPAPAPRFSRTPGAHPERRRGDELRAHLEEVWGLASDRLGDRLA